MILVSPCPFVQGTLKKPHELWSPTYSVRVALLCSTFYFFSVRFPATAFLLPEAAQALVTALLVGQSLLSDITGLPMDWTLPFESLLLTLL